MHENAQDRPQAGERYTTNRGVLLVLWSTARVVAWTDQHDVRGSSFLTHAGRFEPRAFRWLDMRPHKVE